MKKEKLKKEKLTNNLAENVSKKNGLTKEKNYTDLLALATIVILGILIYSNSFSGSFHFDDRINIVENTIIQDIWNTKTLWDFSQTRFVSYWSFALNYHFGGLNVWGYHLVNLIIHLANSCIVYWFTLLIFLTPALKENAIARDKKIIAFAAALLFVSHPLATQSVAYIVQRMASLVALFYLLSISFYLNARIIENRKIAQYLLFTSCGVSVLLAMLTKENAFSIPFAIVLCEIFFLQTKKSFSQFINYRTVLLAALVLGAMLYLVLNHPFDVFKSEPPALINSYQTITSINYLFTQFSVLIKYIGLLFFPINQNLDYDFKLSNSFFELRTLLNFTLLISLVILGIFLFKKYRILSFGIFWFFLTIAIESSIVPLSDLIFEHRTYLPSVGFFIILSTGLYLFLWDKYKSLAVSIFFAIIVLNSYLSFQRNKIWKNERTLWGDVISKSPNKIRAYFSYGFMAMKEGKLDEALKYLNKAIELQPTYPDGYNIRGSFLSEKYYDKALADYNQAIILRPEWAEAYMNRGLLLNKRQQFELALNDFTKVIEISPELGVAYYNRGLTYAKLNQPDKSIADFSTAIKINLKDVKSYNSRGLILMGEKNMEEALKDFNTAISIDPEYPTAYCSRGTIFMNEKSYDKAFSDFSKAISLKPDFAEAYYNRGFASYNLGKKEMACKDMKQALDLGCLPANNALNLVCH